ncbi:hypothetical protein HDV05_002568 [Chytridiales sp. JEL 0842]|nr:hypothetical protein HDV05_002568 [Chytridiales sp. JEL 0842]
MGSLPNSNSTYKTAMECLSTFYSAIDPSLIPPPRPVSEWLEDNLYGFIRGILQYYPEHSQEVIDLFGCSSKPPNDDTITQKIYEWYDLHIGPFKSPKWWSPCSSACSDCGPPSKEPFHSELRTAVRARDGVCLFCWNPESLETARIIAPKENFTEISYTVLQAAGFDHMNQVQNGLLLCANCRGQFDMLNIYVDVVNGKMVVKVINKTNDVNHNDRSNARSGFRVVSRGFWGKHIKDGRKPTEDDGEMALYFQDNEPSIQPSLKALEFHKTACLIWRMAGGAEEDSDDEWDDGDDGGVVSDLSKMASTEEWNVNEKYEESGRQNRDGKSSRFQKMSKNEAPNHQWQDDNRYGFISGILQYYPEHSQEAIDLFLSSKPPTKGTITEKVNEWYDLHIMPFKQYGRNGSSNGSSPKSQSPCSSISGSSRRPKAAANLQGRRSPKTSSPRSSPRSSVGGSVRLSKELSHSDLRTAVRARDGVCLFCWINESLETAHIIAQKRTITDISNTVLQAAGLENLYQIQNGLLLCANCHKQFDLLNRCVDVVNGKMVVKFINRTNDMVYSERSDSWRIILSTRNCIKDKFKDGRKPTEDDGEMALYFQDNEPSIQPSLKALEFHKTACLIWRMAGGAEEDSDDEWDDGDDGGVVSDLSKMASTEEWSDEMLLLDQHLMEALSAADEPGHDVNQTTENIHLVPSMESQVEMPKVQAPDGTTMILPGKLSQVAIPDEPLHNQLPTPHHLDIGKPDVELLRTIDELEAEKVEEDFGSVGSLSITTPLTATPKDSPFSLLDRRRTPQKVQLHGGDHVDAVIEKLKNRRESIHFFKEIAEGALAPVTSYLKEYS